MKKVVKYTVYFEYEDDYWDTAGDEINTGEGHMRYFLEEHNCHNNYINRLHDSIELAGDDICNAGEVAVVERYPKDIVPYKVTTTNLTK